MFEPNDNIPVDTDDLDAFETLFHESKKEEVKEVKEEVVENDNVEDVAEQEPVKEYEDTADEETDTPHESDSEPEEKVEDKPKKVNRVQERFDELTKNWREAERRAQALELQLEELNKSVNTDANKPTPSQNEMVLPDPDAKNEDGSEKYPLGEFDPSYIRDLNRAIIEDEMRVVREQEAKAQAERQAQEQRDAVHSKWVEKLTPISEQYEDFFDKTIELETTFEGLDPGYSDYLVQTIKTLEHGPEVLYYFANNLEEAQAFVKKGPLEATLALGEINALFKGNSKKETKVSSAPPPPQVNKGGSPRKTVTADTDDLDAFADVFFKKK